MPTRVVRTVAVLALAPLPAAGQAALDRSPNLGGTWTPDPGVVQFNFVHRFYVGPAPAHVVVNFPTFTLAVGLAANLGIGTRYSTHSESGISNEDELFARWHTRAGPVVVAVTPAYNTTAKSFDGEVGADWSHGRLTLSGAVRGMTKAFGVDRSRAAVAGGAVIRLNDYVALAGDVASLVKADPGEDPAWSAGILFVIPGSPHTFSLHASNVDVNTIQGSSRRGAFSATLGKPLYGFEFTIPLHLSRFRPWFHRPAAPTTGAGGIAAAVVEIRGLHFRTDTVTVAAGEAVRWTNADPLEHTVTFDDGVDSGRLAQRASFFRRFDRPGTYAYHCTPHPDMKGMVVVR